MAITVQEVVNLPIFNTAKVKAGIDILDQREVEWMSAMEGPVENFVRKQEFILTTGLGCENNPALLFQLVKDVYESDASALAIATGRYIFEIPEEIILFCKENEFILIELPWEIRFADIQRETMKEINKSQERFSEKARQTQKTLIDFVIQGKDLSDIMKYVERELDCSIVFTDNKGRKKSASVNPDQMIHLWYNNFEANEEMNVDKSSFFHMQKLPYHDGYLLKKELTSGTRNTTQGYFIILFRHKKLLSNNALH